MPAPKATPIKLPSLLALLPKPIKLPLLFSLERLSSNEKGINEMAPKQTPQIRDEINARVKFEPKPNTN